VCRPILGGCTLFVRDVTVSLFLLPCSVGSCRLSFKRNITANIHDMLAAKIRLASCCGPWESNISTLQFTRLNHGLGRTCAVLKQRETCVSWQSRTRIHKSFVTESCIRRIYSYEERQRHRNKEYIFQDFAGKFLT
jgi:hypothetical protein